MASEEYVWLLISRAVSGEISPDELDELETIFLDQPELRADYENLKMMKLNPPGALSFEERRALERGINKFNNSSTNANNVIERHLFTHHQLKPLKQKKQ